MDRQRTKQADPNRTVALTTTTSTAVTMATLPTRCTTCTLAPFTSLGIIPPDRQTVQVIQHAIHRPQSMAAQYLHQMYAAQQQHLLLQTAALQQASVCPSSSGDLVQPAAVSPNSITLPASPVTAQLIGRCQTANSTATTISQQAMLLRNRPDNCNQAQMYLRTQMLILTPAATVAAVQTDLPAVTSCSSLPSSSQVQSLALRAHFPGALATAHSVVLKQPVQSQASSLAASLSKTSFSALKTDQLTDASTEAGQADVSQLTPGPETVPTGELTHPVQTHTVVKQQLTFVQQQTVAGASGPRQLQPIALRVASQETNSSPLSFSLKRLTTSSTSSSTSSTSSSSTYTTVPAVTIQPQPPPLLAAPQRRTSLPQVQNQTPPPPPPLVHTRPPRNPPASPQRLSLHSVQALAVHSGRALLTEQELPVAEALIQMPYQNLPPPQTVAVDLKVHPLRHNRASPSGQTCMNRQRGNREDGRSPSPQIDKPPTSLSVAPQQNPAVVTRSSSIISSPSVIRSPQVEEPSQLTTTTCSSSRSSPPSSPPPPILPVAARGPSQPEPAPPSLPGSLERIRTTHVLTHLIEGFVIREGLESFPVGPPSLLEEPQASLPESQASPEMQTSGDTAAQDSPLNADPSDSSDSEVEHHGPAADVAELGTSVVGVLQCEYCGKEGYAHTFVRSKRFCSMTCVRRFSVSCTRRITMLRAGHRPVGRRGRPPGRVNGAPRQQFLSQPHGPFGSEVAQQNLLREEDEEEEEEEPRVPMTTRLRKHAEMEQGKAAEQRTTETISVSNRGEVAAACPSRWNVEQVFAYISSLPGGQEAADQFRTQEIDGQALLLLTEDHLVSTMNLKLGPALKLCAHINCLKDT